MTGKNGDLGDVYVKDIKGSAVLVEVDGEPVGSDTKPFTVGDMLDGNAYGKWEAKVDRTLKAHLGLGVADLPDQCYRDMFDSGMTADEAVADILGREMGDEYDL